MASTPYVNTTSIVIKFKRKCLSVMRSIAILSWSPDELAVVRVLPDYSFMASALEKSKTFFKIGVLPELVGKWHTKPFTNTVSASSNATSSELADTIAVTGSAAPAICSCKQAKPSHLSTAEGEA